MNLSENVLNEAINSYEEPWQEHAKSEVQLSDIFTLIE